MEVKVDENGNIVLDKLYVGVLVTTEKGTFGIAQRDDGIEVTLEGKLVYPPPPTEDEDELTLAASAAIDAARRLDPKIAGVLNALVRKAAEYNRLSRWLAENYPSSEQIDGAIDTAILALKRDIEKMTVTAMGEVEFER